MPLLCPVCKADNSEGQACRRCKADLSMLGTLDEQRAALLAASRRAFESGDCSGALRSAQAADDLKRDEDTRRWLAVLHLCAGNCGAAWRLYRATDTHA